MQTEAAEAFDGSKEPKYIHDLYATILHRMGLDHEKLTYRYSV